MAKKIIWLGMLAMVLAFGIVIIGCDNGLVTENGINGVYVGIYGEMTLNNGNYVFEYSYDSRSSIERGTYFISNNIITFRPTYYSNINILSIGSIPYTVTYYPNERKFVFDNGVTYTRR